MKKSHVRTMLWSSFIVLVALDVFTTLTMIGNGYYEANPFISKLMTQFGTTEAMLYSASVRIGAFAIVMFISDIVEIMGIEFGVPDEALKMKYIPPAVAVIAASAAPINNIIVWLS